MSSAKEIVDTDVNFEPDGRATGNEGTVTGGSSGAPAGGAIEVEACATAVDAIFRAEGIGTTGTLFFPITDLSGDSESPDGLRRVRVGVGYACGNTRQFAQNPRCPVTTVTTATHARSAETRAASGSILEFRARLHRVHPRRY